MKTNNLYYDKKHIQFLETLWGEGYLSPGGPCEVRRLLQGINISNKSILDIGCGSGGITTSLVTDYHAKRVVGIDVEDEVCSAAQCRVNKLKLSDKINILKVRPGVFPFKNFSFDIVFSKDSIVHIENKELLSKEIFRVLKFGGMFVCSDWLRSNDSAPSAAMSQYLQLEDLGFEMASPKRYSAALTQAGFENIILKNRNRWYLEQAKKEVSTLANLRREEFEEISSKQYMNLTIKTWWAMIKVLETGEHCPHHIWSTKPINHS